MHRVMIEKEKDRQEQRQKEKEKEEEGCPAQSNTRESSYREGRSSVRPRGLRQGASTVFDAESLVFVRKRQSYREIGKLLNLNKSTAADIIRRYKDEDRIESIAQELQPRLLDAREKRSIIRKIKFNQGLSAPTLTAELYEETGKKVHVDKVRNAIKQAGFNGRVARKKPYINEINRKRRLTFAKEFVSKTQSWWNNVIFADDSQLYVSYTSNRKLVWRKPNK
ncbi:uncharacterized protein LOC144470594 [Augochlora pura]